MSLMLRVVRAREDDTEFGELGENRGQVDLGEERGQITRGVPQKRRIKRQNSISYAVEDDRKAL
jgi:hypothetical protein